MDIPTDAQTRDLIKVAAGKMDGHFKIRVQRPVPGGVLVQPVAEFRCATLDHIMAPEKWLPMAVGGGRFFIGVALQETPHEYIGAESVQINLPGAIRAEAFDVNSWVDPLIHTKEGWLGPQEMTFPLPLAKKPVVVTAQPPGVTLLPPSTPLTPDQMNHLSMAQNQSKAAEVQVARLEAQLAASAIQSEARFKEAQLIADKQAARDALKAAEARSERLEEKLNDMTRRIEEVRKEQSLVKVEPVKTVSMPEVMALVTGMVAAVSPMVVGWIAANKERSIEEQKAKLAAEESRRQDEAAREKLRLDMEREKAAATIEAAKITAAANERVAVAQQELMKSAINKKDETLPMITAMMSSMGAMAQQTMQVASTSAELLSQAGGGETGLAEVVAEGLKMGTALLQKMGNAQGQGQAPRKQAQNKVEAPKPRQLPPRSSNPRVPGNGAQAAQTQQPAATQTQTVQPPPKKPQIPTFAQLEAAIHRYAAVEAVAKAFFVSAQGDKEVHDALVKHNLRVEDAFGERLLPWITSVPAELEKKKAYLESLLAAIEAEGIKNGMITPEADDGVEDSDEGEEGDEEDGDEEGEEDESSVIENITPIQDVKPVDVARA